MKNLLQEKRRTIFSFMIWCNRSAPDKILETGRNGYDKILFTGGWWEYEVQNRSLRWLGCRQKLCFEYGARLVCVCRSYGSLLFKNCPISCGLLCFFLNISISFFLYRYKPQEIKNSSYYYFFMNSVFSDYHTNFLLFYSISDYLSVKKLPSLRSEIFLKK